MDGSEEVHRVFMNMIFLKQGRVLQSEEWVEEISTGGGKQ
jgi:hypothetical protein